MKKNRILLRADGNIVAGYGHVIRLLSLAAILKKKYSCVFIIQQPDDFLKSQIKAVCEGIIELPLSKIFEKESKNLAKEIIQPDDIVVLDGYDFTTAYQQHLKKSCFKLVCIDDLYDRHFVADVVINHGEGIKDRDYSKEKYTKTYLGTKYAILRPSFLVKPKNYNIRNSSGHRVFINMGGTDQQNYTQKALNVCIRSEKAKQIDVVVGSFYAHKQQLKKTIRSNKNIRVRIHSNLKEKQIAALMKQSSAAICSASTISYEYASVGGILFVYQTVPNQKNIYAFIIKQKVAFDAKDFNKKLAAFENKELLRKYFIQRRIFFSGDSAQKLASIFAKLDLERGLKIRFATPGDVLTYFKWVNDPEVRSNSINTATVPLENHKAWFSSRLKSKNTVLYIITKNGKPLGQVRFDRYEKIAEIDYSIGKAFRGKGYGDLMLKMAIAAYRSKFPADLITAKVKTVNTASNRVFHRLGFAANKPLTIKKTKYQSYSLAAS